MLISKETMLNYAKELKVSFVAEEGLASNSMSGGLELYENPFSGSDHFY